MKKVTIYLGSILMAVVVLAGCGAPQARTPEPESKIQVIATLFPQYDFARQIGGDKVTATKLLAPGIDAHTFEPTPLDIISLNGADLFIYTGDEMEPWVSRILSTLDGDLDILDVSQNVPKIPWGAHAADDHDHDDLAEDYTDHNHENHDDHADHADDHDHDYDHMDDHDDHDHLYDPHIWTSPINAIVMADNILNALIEISPENEDYFRANADFLFTELGQLDQEFHEMAATAQRRIIFHAGRFAVQYLMYEYGITYVASPNETEPSASLVAHMISAIEEEGIPVIFYEELVEPRLANMIASETGAEALLLHTVHNVSSEDFQSGVTYIDLMRQNLENLRRALN